MWKPDELEVFRDGYWYVKPRLSDGNLGHAVSGRFSTRKSAEEWIECYRRGLQLVA